MGTRARLTRRPHSLDHDVDRSERVKLSLNNVARSNRVEPSAGSGRDNVTGLQPLPGCGLFVGKPQQYVQRVTKRSAPRPRTPSLTIDGSWSRDVISGRPTSREPIRPSPRQCLHRSPPL